MLAALGKLPFHSWPPNVRLSTSRHVLSAFLARCIATSPLCSKLSATRALTKASHFPLPPQKKTHTHTHPPAGVREAHSFIADIGKQMVESSDICIDIIYIYIYIPIAIYNIYEKNIYNKKV